LPGGEDIGPAYTQRSLLPAIVARMRNALLFDGPERARKLSRFWALLLLAAVIATAGVITDSTATVIGAMIVAPLMTPILGMVLSSVTADTRNLSVSFLLVVSGACAVVALGWLLGQLTPVPVVGATNAQVAGRVNPTVGDLIAARDRRGRVLRARARRRVRHTAWRRDRDLPGPAARSRRVDARVGRPGTTLTSPTAREQRASFA
jgi:hypothetical protein